MDNGFKYEDAAERPGLARGSSDFVAVKEFGAASALTCAGDL